VYFLLQVGYDGDPEAALVSFASHAQAMSAYRCSEPLFNNRFIKIFWHNPDKSGSTNASLQTSTQGEVCGKFIVKELF
jgi:RNA-binding protein 26